MAAFPKTRAEMETNGYQWQSNSICRGCQERIEFWQTPKLQRIPMNPMDSAEAPAASHFATCPVAQRFRKR